MVLLWVDTNRFTGSVPSTYGVNSALKTLRMMSDSLLTGSIPASLCGSITLLLAYSNPGLKCYASCLTKLSSSAGRFGTTPVCPS